jgi:hypothetical protein
MRTTITINDKLYRTLKLRAVESDETVSKYIEDAIKYQLLEDLEDLEDVKKRENESTQSFNDLVAEFKAEGLL